MTWSQSMGHKGPVLRPRFIGTDRAVTELLLYSLMPPARFKLAIPGSKEPQNHASYHMATGISTHLAIVL